MLAKRWPWVQVRNAMVVAIVVPVAIGILALPCIAAVAAIVVTTMVKHGHPVSFFTLQLLNPYATLFDTVGIGRFHPGFYIGAAQAMCWPGSLIGWPTASGLIIWLLLSLSFLAATDEATWRAIVLGVPLCLVGQFIVQRAFRDAADELKRQAEAAPALAEKLERVEGRALETTVKISRATGCIGVFFGDRSFAPMIRLAELQSRGRATRLSPKTFPLRTSMNGITMDFQTSASGIELGKAARELTHFQNYERFVKGLDNDARVESLGEVSAFDPLLQIAMTTVLDTVATGRFFEKIDRFLPTFDRYLVIDVEDTSANGANVDRHITVEGDASLEVKALFDHRNTITVFLDMSVYRRLAEKVLASLARVEKPTTDADDYIKFQEWTTQQINGPISHELWHFFASKSVSYRSLPLALDEGFATVFQTLTEGMESAGREQAVAIFKAAANAQPPDPATRQAMIATFAATPSATEREYLTLLTRKEPLPSEQLLRLENQDIRDNQPYAEGWLLALDTCFMPGKIREITSALESPELGAQSWPVLDSLLRASREDMLKVRQRCIGTLAGVGTGG